MQWNIAPEYVSLVFVSILIVYSKEYNLIPSLKNRLYSLTLYYVFLEIIISIASIMAIENYRVVPEIANQIIQLLYFLFTPLTAILFMFFFFALMQEGDQRIPVYFRFVLIPYALYVVLVLTNPITGLLYNINRSSGFAEGNGYILVYVVPMLYNVATFIIILNNHKRIERSLKIILLIFLTISLGMIGFQWIFPAVILSGSAATTMLLVIYLYLQNKKIILDDLTGLQNRNAFSKVLEFYVKRGWEMGIILVSLDDFKEINDRFGQLSGDNFLKSISQYLRKILPIKSVFRFSGDEFIIIIDKSIHIQTADVVDNIRKRFGEYWDCGTFRGMLTISIAVVRFPDHADTVGDIITLLEYCIDLSKRTGKGKDVFSDAVTVSRMRRKHQIIDLMKRGLIQDIFEVYYQPIYSTKTKRFTTAEALLRLSDSELGIISPDEFIPIAEETGLIVDIGLLVLDKVCRFIRLIDNTGIELDTISVNLSVVQLNSEKLVENFLKIINKNHIPPIKLCLEITESVFVDKFEYIGSIIHEFNNYEIRVFLDDFGTGYSNISNIVELPFSTIKIDKNILYKSVISTKCLSFISSLSRAFSEIGMKVEVEGVETLEHKKIAEQINVDYMQGNLFAHPMPAAEFINYMKTTELRDEKER